MNRRELIMGAAAVGAAAVLPKVAVAEELSGVAIAQMYFNSIAPPPLSPWYTAYLMQAQDDMIKITGITPEMMYR